MNEMNVRLTVEETSMKEPGTTTGTAIDRSHRGPAPGGVAIVFTALFLASLAVMLSTGDRFPTPYDTPEVVSTNITRHADAFRVAAFLQFGAAIPLGIFTAAITSRLTFLGLKVAGVSI